MIYPTLKFLNISRFKNESTEVSTPKISLSVAIVNGAFLTDLQIHCSYVCQTLAPRVIWARNAAAVPSLADVREIAQHLTA
jgi:hypothetical protein